MSSSTEYNLRQLVQNSLQIPVYPVTSPQDSTYPFIVYSRRGGIGTMTMSGPSYRKETYTYGIRAKTMAESQGLTENLITLLHGYQNEITAVNGSETDDYDPILLVYESDVDFDVIVGATLPFTQVVTGYGSGSYIAMWTDRYALTGSDALQQLPNGDILVKSNLHVDGASYVATSSWAENAVTSSYAVTASWATNAVNAISASYATNAVTLHNALSSSVSANSSSAASDIVVNTNSITRVEAELNSEITTSSLESASFDSRLNNLSGSLTSTQADEIAVNTLKVGITPTQASDILVNTLKVGITSQQSDDITTNNAKVGLTPTQTTNINNTSGTNTGDQDLSGLELLTNKSISVTTDQASNVKYPSVKAVYDWAGANLALKANITTPTFLTNITTPLIIGGTAVGSKITYKSTTGVGTTAGIAHQFIGGTDGATVLSTVLNNGDVGIGTTAPSYQLQLSTNSAAKPSTNTWTITSDERVKENITPYTHGLAEILKLEPKTFDYNGKAGLPQTKGNIGLIAQEAMLVLPETVNTYSAKLNESDEEETELYNFDSHAVTFALINAVKELTAKIEAQSVEIELLKNK